MPPRPDGRYRGPIVEVDPEVRSDAAVAQSFRPGIRPWVAVITTAITALASIVGTYLATHGAPVDCASKGEVNALSVQVGSIQKDLSTLTTTVNANANQVHNDISFLDTNVKGSIRDLDTRLQTFMRH